MTNDREVLLKRIQVCDFAMNDAALYLNLSPEDEMALAFYRKHQKMREEAAAEYVSKYGPLARGDYDGGPRWNWADNPWPWQLKED